MSWLKAIWLAEIHRETYVAILKSWVPHGKRGDFSQRCGISREYFSYLCALDCPTEDSYPLRRYPSPQVARRIAGVLSAPLEIKNSLLENMELARANMAWAYYLTKEFVSQRYVEGVLSDIQRAHQQATFGKDLAEVKRSYRVLRDSAAILLNQINPEIYPASYAQTCLYYHYAQCVLDRPDEALRYAKIAHLILENADYFEPGFSKEQTDNLEINANRGEAVALHNMGLDRQALPLYAHSRTMAAYRSSRNFWEPIVGRDLLNTTVRIPRSNIRDANKLASSIEKTCEHNGDEFTLLLVRESWLRSLILHRRFKQAQAIYQEEIERIPHLPHVGSLHRALLLKSGAQLAWQLHDLSTWQERIVQTLELMCRSGLKHQIRLVRQTYGSALDPILTEFVSGC